MSENVIRLPVRVHTQSGQRVNAHGLLDQILQAEAAGQSWKADALFVRLCRTTGRGDLLDSPKANAAVVAAKICCLVGCVGPS
jgi:hypothetical protein